MKNFIAFKVINGKIYDDEGKEVQTPAILFDIESGMLFKAGSLEGIEEYLQSPSEATYPSMLANLNESGLDVEESCKLLNLAVNLSGTRFLREFDEEDKVEDSRSQLYEKFADFLREFGKRARKGDCRSWLREKLADFPDFDSDAEEPHPGVWL